MKVVGLLWSPRSKGSSTAITGRNLETAATTGAETGSFELNRLSYHGCQACYACNKGVDQCILKDGLAEAHDLGLTVR